MRQRTTAMSIPAEGAWLDASLCHAPDVTGLIVALLAGTEHGTLPLEREIAKTLQRAGFATLLLDLLPERHDLDAYYNVPQMTNRLVAVTEWIEHQPSLRGLPIGLLGSGTTSAVAVRTASRYPGRYAAIVCRCGRPDLAGVAPLRTLATPICIVAGSKDPDAHIAAEAYSLITAERSWQRVPEAGPLFAEGDTLSTFNTLATAWFVDTLHRPPAASATSVDTE
jgi:dienelactone hydrolase